MDRRESEVWGLAAALAVNAPEDQQTNLVAALREKVSYSARQRVYRLTYRFSTLFSLHETHLWLQDERKSSSETSTCSSTVSVSTLL